MNNGRALVVQEEIGTAPSTRATREDNPAQFLNELRRDDEFDGACDVRSIDLLVGANLLRRVIEQDDIVHCKPEFRGNLVFGTDAARIGRSSIRKYRIEMEQAHEACGHVRGAFVPHAAQR